MLPNVIEPVYKTGKEAYPTLIPLQIYCWFFSNPTADYTAASEIW